MMSRPRNTVVLAPLTWAERIRHRMRSLHRDERGVISLLTVFVALMFTVLLGMILNIARHIDDRMRLQNASDAATYTGGVVMARGLNTLAFSNHLLSEVFALTAYMRVAEREDFTLLTEPILAEWAAMTGPMENAANSSGVQKFADLAAAIRAKIPHERAMVAAYAGVSQSHAATYRSAFETILGPSTSLDGGPIVRFQRALVRTTPALAQLASNEIAGRYAGRWAGSHENRPMTAMMWRAHTVEAMPLAGQNEEDPLTRTVPAVDPSLFGPDKPDRTNPDGSDYYVRTARDQRASLARAYLESWTKFWMGPYFGFSYFSGYDHVDYDNGRSTNQPGRETAKMSDYIDMMRSATRAELNQLLEDEFRYTNLPHVYRRDWTGLLPNDRLDRDHTYVGVAYWNHLGDVQPGLYPNRLDQDGVDELAFAQTTVFVPRGRFICCPWRYRVGRDRFGNIVWRNRGDNWSRDWHLLNQNWMAKLVPATSRTLPAVLSARPVTDPQFRPLPIGDITNEEIDRVSFH